MLVTLTTYELTDVNPTISCTRVTEVRTKVAAGKGDWLKTSIVTVYGKVPSECILTVDLSPSSIMGSHKKIVEPAFSFSMEVAYGMRTPATLKIKNQEEVINEVKISKLYTDLNYDITYGVQSIQMTAARLGDIMGGAGEWVSMSSAFKFATQEIFTSMIKLVASVGMLYLGWMATMMGYAMVGVPLMLGSAIPWVAAQEEREDIQEQSSLLTWVGLIALAVILYFRKQNKDKMVALLLLVPYICLLYTSRCV